MPTLLDEIQSRVRYEQQMGYVKTDITRANILALIAVVRDAEELLDNYDNFHDLALTIGDLRTSLAPLQAERGEGAGQ